MRLGIHQRGVRSWRLLAAVAASPFPWPTASRRRLWPRVSRLRNASSCLRVVSWESVGLEPPKGRDPSSRGRQFRRPSPRSPMPTPPGVRQELDRSAWQADQIDHPSFRMEAGLAPQRRSARLPTGPRSRRTHRKREESGTHFRREADVVDLDNPVRRGSTSGAYRTAGAGRGFRRPGRGRPGGSARQAPGHVAHDRRKLAKNGLSKSGGLREDLNARIGLRPGRHLTDRACAPRMTP